MSTPEPTVFIVDDDEAFRDSADELLSSVGLATQTFRSAIEFLETFDPARPGCLLLDVRMARMSGIALQTRLKELGASTPIVFVSGHGDIGTAVGTIKAGAVDFVQKPYREQQLLDAVNEALARDAAQRRDEPNATQTGSGDTGLSQRFATLTPREREVMDLALKGLSSKAIARQLSISHRTVEQHRGRLLEKLGMGSMNELLRSALADARK